MANVLSYRIALIRKSFGLSQKDFGEKIGLTGSYISALELNKRTELSSSATKLISRVFNCSLEWLENGTCDLLLCRTIQREVSGNFDLIPVVVKKLNITEDFLNKIMECSITPSSAFVDKLREIGFQIDLENEKKTQEVLEKTEPGHGLPHYKKTFITGVKDTEVEELKKDRDWLRRQNDGLLDQNHKLLEQNVKLLDQNSQLFRIIESLQKD